MLSNLKKYLLFFVLLPVLAYSQAEEFVIKSGYVVLANGVAAKPTYLVINNGATSAITRTAGGIISEAEYNMIWWNIGTNTGTYTVPFQYSTTNYIPLTFNVAAGSGGTGAGTIKFSTYHGLTGVAHGCTGGATIADNLCYMPSDVLNMDPFHSAASSPTATDDSYYVVDRFWIIDPNTGYTAKPNPIITFTYINSGAASEIAAPNVLSDGTLLAQRFNSTSGTWGDWLGPTGFNNTGAATVSTNAAIGTANFFRSWTLSSSTDPLPIQLTAFSADCDSGNVLIKWSSATEINNNHYTIERSADGINFNTIGIVEGAGTSSTPNDYSYIDYSPLPGTSYYRLSQTDDDGNTTLLNTIPFTQCETAPNTINAYNANGVINVSINSLTNDYYTITLFNLLGQPVLTENHSVAIGNNTIKLYPNVSDGIYIVTAKSEKVNYEKKLFIGR